MEFCKFFCTFVHFFYQMYMNFKKHIAFSAILLGFSTVSFSQNAAYERYIAQWKAVALEQQVVYGIPASITLAQGLLESGAGQSSLATEANNHFGIKCHADWQGGTFRHDDETKQECFRSYDNAADSYRDHSLFLKRPRYEVLFTYPITDYKKWARGLKACGYATDPAYPEKLIRIIETYHLDSLEATPVPQVASAPISEHKAVNKDAPKTRVGASDKSKPSVQNQLPTSTDTVRWRVARMRTIPLYHERLEGRANGQRFIIAETGDTWGAIAYMLDMEESTLRRYNHVDKKHQLQEGDRIFLFPMNKKNRNATAQSTTNQ